MKTFQKTYGNLVVDFNNSNEYVDVGPAYENPKFEGILIREKFSDKGIELFLDQIEFFLKELVRIQEPKKDFPLVQLIHKYGWNNYHSDFVIVISDYKGIRCKFFMNVSHQYNTVFDAIRSNSPEFESWQILEILSYAKSLKDKEK